MIRKPFIILVLVALLAMGGLVVAACGEDEPADTTAATTETTMGVETTQTTEGATDTTAAANGEGQDIVDTAVAAGSFNTLAELLTEAGLVETLKGEGPFTVFAPTDEAFAKIPQETLAALRADTDALTEVLTYHVVEGQVMSGDITDGMEAETVQGSPIMLNIRDGMVYVNDSAQVVQADVAASNGVIHVIDTVLLPPDMQDTQTTTAP